MHTHVPLLVLCSALVLSELISALENFSIRKQLLVFRRGLVRIVDLGRLSAAALLLLSFALGSDLLVLSALLTLGSALLIETMFDPFGLDAGRHASLFLCLGLGLSVYAFTRPIGYAFIVVNVLAMYAWSGLFKLKSRAWRHGDGLPNVLASRGYGLNRWPIVPGLNWHGYLAVSWAFMLVEISVVVAFVMSSPVWATAILMLLAIFHVGTGVIMGLRRFSHAGLVGCGCLLVIRSEYPSILTLFDRALDSLF